MAGLESLSKIASEAIIDLRAEDSAEEAGMTVTPRTLTLTPFNPIVTLFSDFLSNYFRAALDEGDLSDVEAPNERGAHYQPLGDNATNPSGAAMTTELDATVMHWRSQISEPLNYFPSRADKEVSITLDIFIIFQTLSLHH